MKGEKEEIKAILFDVGGVLALSKSPIVLHNNQHRTKGVHEYIAKKLKISIDQWLDSIDSVYSKAIEGKTSKSESLKIISKNNNLPISKIEKIIVSSYKKNFKQNEELYKFAYNLKKQGYKIAILSDQWPVSKEALIIKKYIRPFNEVIISCDVGLRKPNPNIYKLALKKLKISPSQALFIDNQEWNTKPAEKLGMKTIVFKDNKQLFKQLSRYLKN